MGRTAGPRRARPPHTHSSPAPPRAARRIARAPLPTRRLCRPPRPLGRSTLARRVLQDAPQTPGDGRGRGHAIVIQRPQPRPPWRAGRLLPGQRLYSRETSGSAGDLPSDPHGGSAAWGGRGKPADDGYSGFGFGVITHYLEVWRSFEFCRLEGGFITGRGATAICSE